ncbi:UPF0687 protein C20orf27 homolog isoform X2 [Acanthaster planci]|uniref:Adipose-secreted signaling protein n=1 Tax=Acanthaster planci TaxID=133434 RepID=A0A8B7YYJ4_ACAPL|nr:UPF0687 protein C20orf27 homolog isoform X2 [Acanthaster planci]
MATAECSTLTAPSVSADPVVEMETGSSKVVVEETTVIEEEEEEDKPRITRPRGSSRVHFPEDVHDPEIHVSREADAMIDVNLGFLQCSHRYRVCFTVGDSIKGDVDIPLQDKSTGVVAAEAFPTQNGEGHDITIQLVNHRDGVVSEQFELVSRTEPSNVVKVILHCRFISKDQGTPQVKEGIQTMCIEPDPSAEESEGSDWTPYE